MTAVASMIEQVAEAIAGNDARRFLPCGGLTKPSLTACEPDVERLDMTAHHGILIYDPSEFLITARAGTRVGELQAALAEQGQYLPCDPLFGESGSTVGGALASGISGSNRLLYGGLRDFVMEVELIDGTGALVRGGGKVVKNAAGFDLPKLLVGSYGRLGIITEVTFKVFPKPAAFSTLGLTCANLSEALQLSQQLLSRPLPIAALDMVRGDTSAGTTDIRLLVRCGGLEESLPSVLDRAQQLLNRSGEALCGEADARLWFEQSRFVEQPVSADESLLRIAVNPAQIVELDERIRAQESASEIRFTGGGSAAWLRYRDASGLSAVDALLKELKLSAVVIASGEDTVNASGEDAVIASGVDAGDAAAAPLGIGDCTWRDNAHRIQRAIDPRGRFLKY